MSMVRTEREDAQARKRDRNLSRPKGRRPGVDDCP
jgi:hypothetical protein